MSKDIEWGFVYGDGEVVCVCEQCGEEIRFPFEDSAFDFKEIQNELKTDYGWYVAKDEDGWHDFCSKDCARAYKKN